MTLGYLAEWEWGWKSPLLLRFSEPPPPPVEAFLAAPLSRLALPQAEAELDKTFAELRTSRIGIRFERIQAALFRAHPDTTSIRTGLVIPGRTEIDLLHRISSLPDTVIHWEVAVKFYLGVDPGGSEDAGRFIGPSLKDTLEKKTRTIFERQLAVLRDPAVRAEFGPRFGITASDRVLTLPKVHGVLFLPFRAVADARRPETVREAGSRGAWTSIDDLGEFLERILAFRPRARVRWMRDRREWIRSGPTNPTDDECEIELKSYFKSALERLIQDHFMAGGEPIQCTLFDFGPAERVSESPLRFFIVPAGWESAAERELASLRDARTIGS